MPSQWIQHVKAYASEHNIAYKQALKDARPSYKAEATGGKIRWRRLGRQIKRTADKVGRVVGNKAKATAQYAQDIVQKRQGLPPKVRQYLQQHGDKVVRQITLTRAPVNSLITSAMNMVSLGSFNKKFNRLDYDALFHLKMDLVLDGGVRISLEKNEVINMDLNPRNGDRTETMPISNLPEGLTMETMMDRTKEQMGDYRFTNYNPSNNNCQDFIVAVLSSNGISGYDAWVKQNTDALFAKDPLLAKISHTLTNAGASANVAINGSGLSRGRNIRDLVYSA